MKVNNPKILVLSSISPSVGPAIIGEQIYEALRRKGMDVDFMTKYPEPGHPEYIWIVKRENAFHKLLNRLKNRVRWIIAGGCVKESGYFFFYTFDKWPPVSTSKVLKAIKKQYDLVYIVFWQELLSFKTIEEIYCKLHCQIQICGVDYSQMSGGCHFTKDCKRYISGCGKCPAIKSRGSNDFTAQNVKYRLKVYEKAKPIIYGNSYMMSYYKESLLLKNARCELLPSIIINTDIFKPRDARTCRKKYNISVEKEYILFFGSQNLNDERKGISYLIESFNILFARIGNKAAKKILVITAGKCYDQIKHLIPFDSIGFGYVKNNELPDLYSLSTCFISPSVNDAGPMMVYQSLCCGTPVVGFDMGAVKQVVKDKGTGICVPLRDSKGLAEGLMKVMQLPPDEYKKMSERAREVSVQTSSYGAQADLIIKTYNKYV